MSFYDTIDQIASLFGFTSVDRCARKDCGAPGLVQVTLEGPAGPISAKLCIACSIDHIPECLYTMEAVQKDAEPLDPPPPPAGLLE